MGEVRVYLNFHPPITDEQQAQALDRLRDAQALDFSLEEAPEICLVFSRADEKAALVRAQTVMKGFCDGTDIDPAWIGRSLEGGFTAS